jgi:hypothetical protein
MIYGKVVYYNSSIYSIDSFDQITDNIIGDLKISDFEVIKASENEHEYLFQVFPMLMMKQILFDDMKFK